MYFTTGGGRKRKGSHFRGLFLFLSVLLLLGLGGWFVKSATSFNGLQLSVLQMTSTQPILELPVLEGETFQISYIHSVDRLPVYETFQVVEGKLVLVEVQWISFGAGLGYTGQGEMILEDGWVKIKDLNRYTDPLFLRVGTIAEHCLTYREEEFMLRDYVAGMELVRISIDKSGWLSSNFSNKKP